MTKVEAIQALYEMDIDLMYLQEKVANHRRNLQFITTIIENGNDIPTLNALVKASGSLNEIPEEEKETIISTFFRSKFKNIKKSLKVW